MPPARLARMSFQRLRTTTVVHATAIITSVSSSYYEYCYHPHYNRDETVNKMVVIILAIVIVIMIIVIKIML